MYNKTDVIGNHPGNLYNGGLFCEQGDKIFFSNFNDDGSLYSMSLYCDNVEKIYNDRICFINADDNYIYYSRINNQKETSTDSIFSFFNTGIYRLKKNGKNINLLYNQPSGMLQLFGNYIYYQHYAKNDGVKFYRVKINGKEEKELSKENIMPASIRLGNLYYTGTEHDRGIHSFNLENSSDQLVFSGQTFMPLTTDNGIYYISTLNNYSINRVDYAGGSETTLVSERCSTFNISADEQYLYYQVDSGENNRICVMDLSTGTSKTIIEGNFKEIHVTSNYVFFRSFDETLTYSYATNGSEELTSFNPDVERK